MSVLEELKTEAAEKMTDAFFRSEEMANRLWKEISKREFNSMELAFALLTIDKLLSESLEEWETVKALAVTTFIGLENEGIFDSEEEEDENESSDQTV